MKDEPGPWPLGEPAIARMLSTHDLDRVTPSADHAQRLLVEAEHHLTSSHRIANDDPTSAYILLYDAARKSLSAVLAIQGLRVTSKAGGHAILQTAVEEQLGQNRVILRPLTRIRRTRHETDYPSKDSPTIDAEDIAEDLALVRTIIDSMRAFIPNLGPF